MQDAHYFDDAPSRRRPVDSVCGPFSVLQCLALKVMNIEFVNTGEVTQKHQFTAEHGKCSYVRQIIQEQVIIAKLQNIVRICSWLKSSYLVYMHTSLDQSSVCLVWASMCGLVVYIAESLAMNRLALLCPSIYWNKHRHHWHSQCWKEWSGTFNYVPVQCLQLVAEFVASRFWYLSSEVTS